MTRCELYAASGGGVQGSVTGVQNHAYVEEAEDYLQLRDDTAHAMALDSETRDCSVLLSTL
jgi:hypothetical protein